MQIPEAPEPDVCATCGPLSWQYSKRREVWLCFVAAGERGTQKLHGCCHAQDAKTWREIPHGDPPNTVYKIAKARIAAKEAP
jgi:hypothetical protein